MRNTKSQTLQHLTQSPGTAYESKGRMSSRSQFDSGRKDDGDERGWLEKQKFLKRFGSVMPLWLPAAANAVGVEVL